MSTLYIIVDSFNYLSEWLYVCINMRSNRYQSTRYCNDDSIHFNDASGEEKSENLEDFSRLNHYLPINIAFDSVVIFDQLRKTFLHVKHKTLAPPLSLASADSPMHAHRASPLLGWINYTISLLVPAPISPALLPFVGLLPMFLPSRALCFALWGDPNRNDKRVRAEIHRNGSLSFVVRSSSFFF